MLKSALQMCNWWDQQSMFSEILFISAHFWSHLGRMTSVLSISCRCVSCTQCGATTPGLRCEWQNNYTQCAPCASLATCPICLVDYSEGTTILQCRQCDRCAVFLSAQGNWSLLMPLLFFYIYIYIWKFGSYLGLLSLSRWFHASCQSLHSEEDVEKAADSSFDCTMCRAFKTTKGERHLFPQVWQSIFYPFLLFQMTFFVFCGCCSCDQGQRHHWACSYDADCHKGKRNG